jgi:hypothetical protein
MTEKKTAPAFEAECSTIDEFLRMLELRESEQTPKASYQIEERSALRRAVFVSQLQDIRGSMGFPSVARYVVAGFAYGEDLVSIRVYTSRGMEIPHGAPDAESPVERQGKAYEEISEKIRERIADSVLDVPVVEGFLHHATDPRSEGTS